MLDKLHASIKDLSLGDESANVLVRSILYDIQQIDNQFQAHSLDWADQAVHALRLLDGVEEGSKTAKVCLLKVLKDHWDDLPPEFKTRYSYSHDVLIMRETRLLPSTVQDYMDAVDTFIFKNMKPFAKVQVPKRDSAGRPVIENNEVVMQDVEFDPTRVPITKLVRAKAAAKRGLMEPGQRCEKIWALMMDKEATVEDIDKIILGTNQPNDPDPSLTYRLEGNIITASEMGETAEIAEIFFDVGKDEMAGRAIREILRRLGIQFEEDVIARMIANSHKEVLGRVYDNSESRLINGPTALS